MRIILSLIFTACLATHAYADVYVLCYHTFLDKKNVNYDFSQEELKSHLKFLADRGFRFISLKELQEGRVSGDKNVLVTIDDGNHSVYRAFYDVFRPLGIRPLLSIYPNIIGKKDYALTWPQLKELSGAGCDIAAHGYYHLKLNKKLYDENKRDFTQEIVKSKKVLEDKLGIPVTSFVYPFGLSTDVGEEALRNAGYRLAFTIVNNPVKLPLAGNRNLMKLPRYMLTRSHHRGSLNHIANIAGRKDRSVASAEVQRPRKEAAHLSATAGKESALRPAVKKQVVALRRNGSAHSREDIRMGVAYADQRGPEKAGHQNGRKKKKKASARKKVVTAAPAPPAEAKVIDDLEVRRQAPADTVFQYNLSMGTQRALSGSTAAKASSAGAASMTGVTAETPGRLKSRWNVIAEDIVEFYNGVIRAHLSKAEKYLQMLVARVGG